jgi:signal transduction histidine kinase
MQSPQSWFVLICLLGAVISLLVVIPAFRNRNKPGATGLLIVAPGASLFSIAVAPLWTPLPDWAVYAANNAIVTAGFLLGLGWFVTVGEHTETISPSRRLFAVAGVYGALVQGLALTDPLHRLFFFPIYAQPSESLVALPVPVNIVHILCMYTLALVACGLLFSDILENTGIRRKQSSILLTCIVLPVVLNVFHLLDITSLNWMPLGFVAMTLGIGWAVLRADFLDLVSVSRSRAIRSMGDPVVAIDTKGRILDANPAARKLSDVDTNGENTPVTSFFRSFPDLAEQLQTGNKDTVTVSHRGRKRDFSLTISEVGGREEPPLARVVVLREVTQLKQRERELELLSQVQSRVLRHNIRNELDVIKAQNEQLAAELDGRQAQLAETTLSSADRLLSISSKARVVEQLVDHDENPTTVDLTTTVEQLLETHREAYPEVTFSVESPNSCSVETLPSMELALDNLIENAAEHNTATEPTVEVVLTNTDDEVVVSITDNGPGIPEQELTIRSQDGETQLKHGKGVGLWVVDSVIESSGASLAFETGTEGTTATVRLPRR